MSKAILLGFYVFLCASLTYANELHDAIFDKNYDRLKSLVQEIEDGRRGKSQFEEENEEGLTPLKLAEAIKDSIAVEILNSQQCCDWRESETATQWDKFLGSHGLEDKNRLYQSDRILWQQLGSLANKKVLDYGCGNGYLARRLEQAGARVSAVDINQKFIEICRAYSAEFGISTERLRYELVPDNGSLPENIVPSADFDLVVSNYVIMDVQGDDYIKYVENIYRALRYGGQAIVVLLHPMYFLIRPDNRFSYEDSYFTPGKRELVPFHSVFTRPFRINHRSCETYEKVFERAGFRIISRCEPCLTEDQKKILDKNSVEQFSSPISLLFHLEKFWLGPNGESIEILQSREERSVNPRPDSPDLLGSSDVSNLIWEKGYGKKIEYKHDRETYLKGKGPGWRIPTIWELFALYCHRSELGDPPYGGFFWSDTKVGKSKSAYWVVNFDNGTVCGSGLGSVRTVSLRAVHGVEVRPSPSDVDHKAVNHFSGVSTTEQEYSLENSTVARMLDGTEFSVVVENNTGGGECLFLALGTKRETLAEHLVGNAVGVVDLFVAAIAANELTEVGDWYRRMALRGPAGWGGDFEIGLFTRLHNVRVEIFQLRNGVWEFVYGDGPANATAEPILLGRTTVPGGEHYVRLRPVGPIEHTMPLGEILRNPKTVIKKISDAQLTELQKVVRSYLGQVPQNNVAELTQSQIQTNQAYELLAQLECQTTLTPEERAKRINEINQLLDAGSISAEDIEKIRERLKALAKSQIVAKLAHNNDKQPPSGGNGGASSGAAASSSSVGGKTSAGFVVSTASTTNSNQSNSASGIGKKAALLENRLFTGVSKVLSGFARAVSAF